MTRDDSRVFWRMALAFAASIGLLWLLGSALLLINPPTDMDKQCLASAARDIGECFRKFHQDQNDERHRGASETVTP